MSQSIEDQSFLEDINDYMEFLAQYNQLKTTINLYKNISEEASSKLTEELAKLTNNALLKTQTSLLADLFQCTPEEYTRFEKMFNSWNENKDELKTENPQKYTLFKYLSFQCHLNQKKSEVDCTLNTRHNLFKIPLINHNLWNRINREENIKSIIAFKTRLMGPEYTATAETEFNMICQKLDVLKPEMLKLEQEIQELHAIESDFTIETKPERTVIHTALDNYRAKFEELYELLRFKL